MKSSALILAGAVAFDLGILVVAGQAAEAPTAPAAAPAAPGRGKVFAKVEIDHLYLKVDAVNTARACDHKHGKVVVVEGVSMCRLPAQGAPAPGGRGGPAIPRPDEK